MHRKQLAKHRRQRGHHAHSRRNSQQPASQSEPQRLQKKNPQQVTRSRPHRLQNRQHIHALFQMRMHGHCHADRPQHHRYQADQAQDRRCIIQPLRQPRIPLTEIHHLRIRQRLFNLLAQRHGIDLRRQFHQQPLGRAAPRRNQPRPVKRRLRNHHSRPKSSARAHAVRLLLQNCRNLECSAAQPQRLSHMRIQADQEFLRHHCRVALQSPLQAHRRLQLRRSIIGILARIDSLQRNQQRHRIGRHGSHRNRLRHPRRLNLPRSLLPRVLFLNRRELAPFVVGGKAKNARAQVARHQRSCFSAQSLFEAIAEPAHAHQRRHSNGNGQHHKSEFARSRLQIPPANRSRPFPAQRPLSHVSPWCCTQPSQKLQAGVDVRKGTTSRGPQRQVFVAGVA